MVDADRPKVARDRPQRAAHAEPSRNLLSFRKAERPSGTVPIRRTDAAGRRNHREDRRGLPVKSASDRTHGRNQMFHKTASSLKHYTSLPCSLAVSSRFVLLAQSVSVVATLRLKSCAGIDVYSAAWRKFSSCSE